MTTRFILTIGLALSSLAQVHATPPADTAQHPCNKKDAPRVIKPMENWDIIATNTGTIDMSAVFSGNQLTYAITAHPSNLKNRVTINRKTGIIQVKAEKQDNFDIVVKAGNSCGTTSTTFNVIINEEE